mmetsp:Transcript_9890/g.16527  ORF Transcript_9890/g.16527 Transcript_9890/m.16527 type:complete len:255 (-) Transcript_9890:499-1263(-)
MARTTPTHRRARGRVPEVRDNDVLGGKGGHTNHHLGNVRYRKIVRHFKSIFALEQCPADEKRLLANSIASTLKDRFGTRFLKTTATSGDTIIEMDTKATAKKIMQCFREKMKGFEIPARTAEEEARVSKEAIEVTHLILSQRYPSIYKVLCEKYGNSKNKTTQQKKDTNEQPENEEDSDQDMSDNEEQCQAAVPSTDTVASPSSTPLPESADGDYDDDDDVIIELDDSMSCFSFESEEEIPAAAPWVDRLIPTD